MGRPMAAASAPRGFDRSARHPARPGRHDRPGLLCRPGPTEPDDRERRAQGARNSKYSPRVRSVTVTGSSVRLRQNQPWLPVKAATSSPS